MSYLDWHVGMKVVCTKRGGWLLIEGGALQIVHPEYGEICTITSLDIDDGGRLFIAVEGRPSYSLYDARRFRPDQKRDTSIEVFTTLLNPSPEQIGEVLLEEFILEHSEVPFQ